MFGPSWKTTLCGLLSVFFGVIGQIPELPALYAKILVAAAAFTSGLGLMFARDNGVSSAQIRAASGQPEPPKP